MGEETAHSVGLNAARSIAHLHATRGSGHQTSRILPESQRTQPDGPLVVHEIVSRTALTQPNVSNHLRCLTDCGLVTSMRDGRFVRYRTSSPRIADLLRDADALLDVVAESVEACPNYQLKEDEAPPRGT